MAEDINLLPVQGEENKAEVRQKKMIKTVSVAALVIVIAIVAVLGGVKLALAAQVSSVEKQISQHTAEIEAKSKEEYTLRALSAKLTQLSTFFASQNHYSTTLTELVKTMPTSIKATNINVDDQRVVTFMGTTSSYADLAGFYTKLLQAGASGEGQSGTYFQNPTLTTISRSEQSGEITFTMTFALAPAALVAPTGAAQ